MKVINLFPLKNSIQAQITIPGSKSYTNRALLLAVMCINPVKIINPLFCDDTEAMIQCLQTLGIKIEIMKNSIHVLGSTKDVKDSHYDLDTNLSGTAIRFLLALSTIIPGVKTLYGKEGLNKRPIGELVGGLRQLGAKIEYLGNEGYPPLRVLSSKLSPGIIKINGEISSQFLSAMLMITPQIGKIDIKVKGNQISKPYINMTIDAMKKFGVDVINKGYKQYIVPDGQVYKAQKYIVEGDFSSAGYFLAIAALTKSTLTLKNLSPNSVQADRKIVDVLEQMGSKITYGLNKITIKGNGVKSIHIDMIDFPDQVQTIAVLAAFAKGITTISGIQSLRIKETDRITALQQELKKMNIKTTLADNTLNVYGGKPKTAIIDTYGDHRMAMSFAIAGTKLEGMKINDPDVVNKTFPDFWNKLKQIGVGL